VLPWILLAVIPLPNRGWKLYFVPASLVVLIEWLHSNVPWGGFPWGNLAYAQLDGPLVGLAMWGGQSLVTAAVVICAVALVQLVVRRRIASALGIVSMLAILSGWAQRAPVTPTAEQLTVALIQGNSPVETLDGNAQQWLVFDNHIRKTEELARQIELGKVAAPEVIVWPENSTDVDPLNNVAAFGRIQGLVERIQVPILIGGVTWQSKPYGPRNAGILWSPDSGPNQLYAKTHLVPFGEYIPFRDVLAARIGRFSQIPSDFIAGNGPGIFQLRGRTFGDVICFEIAYENHLTELVNKGASFFTLQTNNATYIGTQQSKQQFAIARFRAIEHRRSVVMASTTGVSGVVTQSGEVVAQSRQGESVYLVSPISANTSVTFTDRHPQWVLRFSVLILAILLVGQIRNKRRVDRISSAASR
jgi:apolipoprotein N-acyltransferase